MAPRWNKDHADRLQDEIARIRQLSQQVEQAHELLTANTELLVRDRNLIRSGPLREVEDLRTDERQLEPSHCTAEPRRRVVPSRRRR